MQTGHSGWFRHWADRPDVWETLLLMTEAGPPTVSSSSMPTEVLCTLQTAMEPNPAYWYPPGLIQLSGLGSSYGLSTESECVLRSMTSPTMSGRSGKSLPRGRICTRCFRDGKIRLCSVAVREHQTDDTICSFHGKISLGRSSPSPHQTSGLSRSVTACSAGRAGRPFNSPLGRCIFRTQFPVLMGKSSSQ